MTVGGPEIQGLARQTQFPLEPANGQFRNLARHDEGVRSHEHGAASGHFQRHRLDPEVVVRARGRLALPGPESRQGQQPELPVFGIIHRGVHLGREAHAGKPRAKDPGGNPIGFGSLDQAVRGGLEIGREQIGPIVDAHERQQQHGKNENHEAEHEASEDAENTTHGTPTMGDGGETGKHWLEPRRGGLQLAAVPVPVWGGPDRPNLPAGLGFKAVSRPSEGAPRGRQAERFPARSAVGVRREGASAKPRRFATRPTAQAPPSTTPSTTTPGFKAVSRPSEGLATAVRRRSAQGLVLGASGELPSPAKPA